MECKELVCKNGGKVIKKFLCKSLKTEQGFLVKNLDLDSNLYNLKSSSKKLVKYYETDPNPKRPYS
jgi:hypothetical protein